MLDAANHDRYARFFALSRDLLAVADLDGWFVDVNGAWTDLLGWSREELLERPYAWFVHPDDLEPTQREAAAQRERGTTHFVNRYRTRDGRWRWLEWVSERRPEDGLIYATARDVTDRQEAFEAQRLAEERHRQLIDNLPDTVITQVDRNLVITYVGGGGLRLSGLDGQAFVGRPLAEVYEPYGPRRDELVGLHVRAQQGETIELQMRSVLSDDEYELRILPVTDHAGAIDGTMVVATNVTQRVRAERRNRELATLVDTTAEAILSIDPHGIIEWVNQRACELYGYPAAEIVGRPVRDLVAGDDFDETRRWIHEANLAGEAYRGDHEHVDRFGRVIPVAITVSPLFDTDGAFLRCSMLVRDISERKATEARLREADRRFEQALIHAPSGMAIVDLDGSWIEVNDALCRMVGYTHEELLGKTFVDITHPEDIDGDVAHVEQLILGYCDSYEAEKRYIRKDGSTIWSLLTVSVVRDHDGRALHFISQILDIDERKRAEQRLLALADADGLTGLINRRRFTEILDEVLAGARRTDDPAALLFIDLDGFKNVNDTCGHAAGDELLCAVARALEHRLRATDVIARYGGDEFVVLLEHISPQAAVRVADELREVIARAAASVPGGEDVTASIGLTVLDETAPATASAAMDLADAAMYERKLARR